MEELSSWEKKMDKEFQRNNETHDLIKDRVNALDTRLTLVELKIEQTKTTIEKAAKHIEEMRNQSKQLEGGWKAVQLIGFIVAGAVGWIVNHFWSGHQ